VLIRAANLAKSYGAEAVLDSVSFAIRPGDKVGLVGPNGSGKTTLLRLLLREIEPDDGELFVAGEPATGYFRQDVLPDEHRTVGSALLDALDALEERLEQVREEVADDPDDDAALAKLEVLEDEFNARFGHDYRSRAEKVLGRLGFGRDRLETSVATLSPGERARLELARVLVVQPELLVLDEPTNFLDIGQREWLEQFLEEFEGTVLVVSHDRQFLNNTVTRILELRRGRVREYEGDYSDYEAQRRAEQEKLEQDHAEQTKEIRKLEAVARDRKTWSARREKTKHSAGDSGFESHRAAKMAKRAKHAEKRIEQALERHRAEKPFVEKRPHPVLPAKRLPEKRALLVKAACKAFGRRKVLDGVGFELRNHERVALIGPNGSGKTVLLRAIVGELALDEGEVRVGAGLRVGYFPQDLATLDLAATAVEEVRKSGCNEETARTVLGTLLLAKGLAAKKLGQLSAGERSKALLGRILAGGADLLVLDEPTNHLDVAALVALEQLLLGFPGPILFATHDRAILGRLATRILEVTDGKLLDFRGRYDQYRARQQSPGGEPASRTKTT
jgi:ATP-binding cassette subfamily F protein 3